MIKNKNVPVVNAVESAKVINDLIKLAIIWRGNKEFSYKLASALIYANMAEFIASGILTTVIFDITVSSLFKQCSHKNLTSKRTDLETTISQLEALTFPLDDKIISSLNTIKFFRNKLFHSLLTVHENGQKIDSLINNLQKNTDKLMELYLELNNMIEKNNKSKKE